MLILGFPDGSVVKNLPVNVGDMGLIPGLGRHPGEANDNPLYCSFACKIPWTKESGGYHPWGHKRVEHDLATKNNNNNNLLIQPPGSWLIVTI